ncbi:MAG: sugar phosphate isomerase/epimerase family protein [Gemmatimonadales bacterium]|jgi:sugar phosphate isomerase/epimerase
MISRREFVQTAALAAAATAVPRSLRALPGAARLDRLGLQLYTVRSEMAKSVESTLERVASIGYKEVEFAGYFNREPAKLRETLDKLGLAAPSTHLGLGALENQWDATAASARTLGHRWVVVASVGERGAYDSIASIKALAGRFNAVGRKARDAGLRYGYHNHNAELKVVEGAVPLHVLLSETDPALVDFEMDVYWVTQGGGDPLALIVKYPGRFHLVHAKDSSGAPAHEMRDVGAGTIDWKMFFAQRKKAGIEHVFVEHDAPSDPFASVAASYKYLKALEF